MIEYFKEAMKIDEDLLLEMAKVGNFSDKAIYVRSNDGGNLPHFHVVDSSTLGNEFHSCIKLLEPEYFIHEGKEDKLNSSEKKRLVKFLKSNSTSKRFSSFTNWEVLVTLWNMNNSDRDIDEDAEMPDYTRL